MTDEKTEKPHNRSLSLSGWSYLLGDAAMFASSMLIANSKDAPQRTQASPKLMAATGLLWGAGGVATAAFGNPSAEKQLDIVSHKLEKFLIAHGAHVSDATREKAGLSPNDFWHNTTRFLYEHPSEVLNALYAAGALTVGAAGLSEKPTPIKKTKDIFSSSNSKLAMGGLVMAGALGGLLIKEDPDAMKKAEHGNALDKAVAWVKEKPLRISSGLYTVNNVFTISNALADRKKYGAYQFAGGLKPHFFSFLCAAAYVVGNGLLFMSPRNQIEDKQFSPEALSQLRHAAAEIIGAQPKALQEQLLNDVSEFLAQEKSIPLSAGELAAQMHHEVQTVKTRRTSEAGERSWRTRHEAAQHALQKETAR